MADTRRTKAEILALFADNASGDITPQDLRDAVVSIMGGYAGVFVEDGATAQTIDTNLAKMTAFVSGTTANGCVIAADKDSITTDVAGIYQVNFCCSFKGTVSKIFRFEIVVDGVPQNRVATTTTTATVGQIRNVSINATLNLSAGVVIEIHISGPDGATSVTPIDAQFTVTQLE